MTDQKFTKGPWKADNIRRDEKWCVIGSDISTIVSLCNSGNADNEANAASLLARRWILIFSSIELTAEWRSCIAAAGLEYIRTGIWIKDNSAPQFTGDRPASGFECVTIAHPKTKKNWNGGGSRAVWTIPIELNRSHSNPRLHTAQKPLKLISKIVSLFSDPHETILDPFMGSGTTLRAAKDLGRKAIGIEIEEKYCEIAAKRMSQLVLPLS